MAREGEAAGTSVRDRTPWCWRQHRWAHTRGRRRLGAALWEWVRPCCYHGCVGAPACQRTLCEGQEQHQVEHRLAEERRRAGDSLSAPSLEEARVAEYASVAGPRWSGWGAHGGMGRRGGAGARRTQRAGQGGALSRTREWSRGTGPAWCARPAGLCGVLVLMLAGAAAQDAGGAGGSGGGATLYIAGSFGRFTTADGTVHNVTGVGEWVAEAKGGLGTIKPLGLGLSLPNEGVALDYHPSPPNCERSCKNSQTCWTTCVPGSAPALYIGGSFTAANGEEVYRVTVARNRYGTQKKQRCLVCIGAPSVCVCVYRVTVARNRYGARATGACGATPVCCMSVNKCTHTHTQTRTTDRWSKSTKACRIL